MAPTNCHIDGSQRKQAVTEREDFTYAEAAEILRELCLNRDGHHELAAKGESRAAIKAGGQVGSSGKSVCGSESARVWPGFSASPAQELRPPADTETN
jgi:hypothetical protein